MRAVASHSEENFPNKEEEEGEPQLGSPKKKKKKKKKRELSGRDGFNVSFNEKEGPQLTAALSVKKF